MGRNDSDLDSLETPKMSVVLKYEMGIFWRNGAKGGERGRNGQFLGEMGMIKGGYGLQPLYT